jgi:diguanylate cyclase (GGDEF)-like protein/PAS domain S-box-containing protein
MRLRRLKRSSLLSTVLAALGIGQSGRNWHQYSAAQTEEAPGSSAQEVRRSGHGGDDQPGGGSAWSIHRPDLRVVLPLTLALLSLATGALVTWQLASIATEHSKRSVGEHLAEQALDLSERLELGMFERYREIQALAGITGLSDLRLEASNAERLRRLLASLQATYRHYAWIGFADPRGRVLASTDGLLEGVDVSDRPWFQAGRDGPFVGDVHEAALLTDLLPRATDSAVPRLVDFAAPVYDEEGALVAVLGAHLYWRWAEQVVESQLAPFETHHDVQAMVLRRDGEPLLYSGSRPSLDGPAIVADLARGARTAGQWAVERLAQGASISAYHESRGHADYPGLGWVTVVRQPLQEAYRPVTELREQILLWGLMIGAMFALLGLVLASWITRPLTAITQAAQRLGDGDRGTRIPSVSSYGEVFRLARALHRLLNGLAARDQSLSRANEALRHRADALARSNESLTRATRAREQAERERDNFFDLSADLMAICDGALRLRRVNQRWGQILGHPIASLVGLGLQDLIHAEERGQVEEAIDSLPTTGVSVMLESRLPAAIGGERWIQWRLTASTGLGGERLLFATGRDITEQRRDQEQLLIWRKVIDAIRTGYLVTDPHQLDNPIIAVNPAFTAITGYQPEEVIGRNCRFLHGEDHDQPGLKELRLCVREERACRVELRNYRKDGSLFWNDVLIAPIHDEQGRLLYFVGVQDDVTERKTFEQQLERQATHDPLTALPNRVLLRDRLRRALARARRQCEGFTVLCIDLDRFKQLNDSLGHAGADQLLQQVAASLAEIAGDTGTVARQGGDEFIIITDALGLADQVHRRLSAPFRIQGQEVYVTASIGVSRYPVDGSEAEQLLRHAEDAMRQAKLRGRNTICRYRAEMTAVGAERVTMERALHHALERGELEVHYQPQLELGSGRTIGCEALLRWRHQERGWVSPAIFIPLAEESGLIHPIGAWVLETACRQLCDWRAQGLVLPAVSVNVSAQQFKRGGIIELVQRVLKETQLEPSGLELEITETVMMEHTNTTLEILHRLKSLGVGLAIDDYGTGYASLSYLKRFPVDRLKIDRTFIRDLPDDADDAAIAVSVIALARSLRLRAIAEGVETVEQREFLSLHGCHEIQGYHYGRPLPPAEMTAFLRAG